MLQIPLRIAHFSDLHYSARHLAETDRCFSFAIGEAIRRDVHVAVISGDATDHALDMHSPAVQRLAYNVRRLADHCPVLMLQGTLGHEPPGTLSILRLLGGRYPVHVADRIEQVALLGDGRWQASEGWRFEQLPRDVVALFSCVPTVNKATVAAAVGATEAASAIGHELSALLAGFASGNEAAREAGVPTIGVSHGTVSGCITEHGVPMAGFDHEFTSGALFAAQAQAFLLGHIHRHQIWQDPEGRLVAYAGSIGRFHYGEEGDKGLLLWQVGAAQTSVELIPTPARRTVDLRFEGKPDLEAIRAAAADRQLEGAFVRVSWSVPDEERHEVDRAAIQNALQGAAEVKLEGRIIPVLRSRAAGISRSGSIADKVNAWARVTGADPQPLLRCLEALQYRTSDEIACAVLAPSDDAAQGAQAVVSTAADPDTCELSLF